MSEAVLDALVAHVKRILPELQGRVAGFPYLPEPKAIEGRFDKMPYAVVLATGMKIEDRQPADTMHYVSRFTVRRDFDVALFFDPQVEGQAGSSLLSEDLPDRLIMHITNWTAACHRFEPLAYEPVLNSSAMSAYALSVAGFITLQPSEFEPLDPLEAHPLVGIKLEGR
ncbi:MAG: hypothetical protein AB7F96_16435 [Beijerinckiaceae bacterium]